MSSITSNDWKKAVKLISDERDAALNALTVTQEEWLLRVKNLELENYKLELENYKLKNLILLTDSSVSDQEMNSLSLIQWNEFIRWKEQK